MAVKGVGPKPKKIEVKKSLEEYSVSFENVKELVEEFSQYENPRVYLDSGYYEEGATLDFYGERDENPDERKKRLAVAKAERERKANLKAANERADREKLRKLLAKYPDEVGL
jgi:Cft2 family RNA processing exonuclease